MTEQRKKWLKEWKAKNRDKINAYGRNYYIKHKDKTNLRTRGKARTLEGKYVNARSMAKKRGQLFSLTQNDYIKLIEADACYYCSQILPAVGSGLDRIDNTKGYEIENVRPCCIACNRAKNNMSEADFFNLIKLVYNKHIKGSDSL
jgi:hypothetical protein